MPLITATNVERTFTAGTVVTQVLKGITMTVARGEFLGIMGRSGAGKSTLMYQLSLLDEPTTGTIRIADTDITQLSEAERTSFRLGMLGYVFQDYALVPDLSAEENVMLPILMRGGAWTDARTESRRALDDGGLAGKYGNLPSQLSGGEQQRVAIARAVAGKPQILFADEPTANLDSVSGRQIIDLIGCLNRTIGQTVVMVTHEREYADNCHRIIHMEDGRIVHEEHLRPLEQAS